MSLKKNTISDNCESTVRKTLFKGEGPVTVGTGTCTVRGRQMGLNFQYSMGEGEFSERRRAGISGRKIPKREHQG